MFYSFIRDSSGNVAVMFSGLVFVLLGTAGFAIDSSVIRSHKMSMQAAVDASALAGAAIAVENPDGMRSDIAESAFYSNITDPNVEATVDNPLIAFDDANAEISVTATARPKTYIMGLFSGRKRATIEVSSKAGYQSVNTRPISMVMVLDVSGSMGWNTSDGRIKIEVLKSAANGLMDAVEQQVNKPGSVSIPIFSAVSTYNSSLVETPILSGGFTNARYVISGLTAGGGTSSTDALDEGLDALLGHPDRVRDNHREFLVFMTDGDNNDKADDPLSADICVKARENDITVYSVAFTAPEAGKQLLLQCASSDNDPVKKSSGKTPKKIGRTGVCDKGLDNPGIRKKCADEKNGYYFDAETATEFKSIFESIGASIGDEAIRLTD